MTSSPNTCPHWVTLWLVVILWNHEVKLLAGVAG
jgi:hypothetical protein